MTAGWWVAIALYVLGMPIANPYMKWVDDYVGLPKDTKSYPSLLPVWPIVVIIGLIVILYEAIAALKEQRTKQ